MMGDMNMKIMGIKKAVGEANHALSAGLAVRFYLNTKTGKVWAMDYPSVTSYSVYFDSDIIEVCHYDGRGNFHTTIADVQEAAQRRIHEVMCSNAI